MAKAYLKYRIKAQKRHGVHSPFVYDLSEEVIHKSGAINSDAIEGLRKDLTRDSSRIKIKDHGAGSRINRESERSISEIAKVSASPKKIGQLLQRLASYLHLENILELGTNLGLTTAYLASSYHSKVWSLEGDPTLASLAVKNLQKVGLKGEIIVGRFEDTLDLTLDQIEKVELAYLDGNHQKKPTIEYFEKILPFTNTESVIAIGDIHWSQDMEEAWEEIKEHSAVSLTIDLFDIGLVFFRTDRAEKEHFTIRL
ncbi:MAG: class I SAM-dependent methyltransferase [Flavobacteriales bacterium]|nr:class I SAM-dependent methyltransferase [Flavobacteriales bacterium]